MPPQRRSRMRRVARGKRLALTVRDIEIFKALSRYRYLRSTYLHAFVGGASDTRFKERLGDLFHEGYIDRPAKQWEFADARCRPAVYEIGEGARRLLEEHTGGENDARTFLAAAAHRQFAHSVLICECLASIELATLERPGLRFIPWPEILARSPERTRASATPFRIPMPYGGYVIPDGLFGLEYAADGRKAYRFFALEADRGTMPVARSDSRQTFYLAKLAAYRQILAHQVHRSHLGIPNLMVLTLTTNDKRMLEMMRWLETEPHTGNAAFLFKSVGASSLTTPANQLLFNPWQRPGLLPLRIDE